MVSPRSKRYKERVSRRAMRVAKRGRQLEERVEMILSEMVRDGDIKSYTRHLPNSEEDMLGRDFTVSKVKEEKNEVRSFGVTISLRVYAKRTNRKIKEFCFPPETKKETIKRRILELFEEDKK